MELRSARCPASGRMMLLLCLSISLTAAVLSGSLSVPGSCSVLICSLAVLCVPGCCPILTGCPAAVLRSGLPCAAALAASLRSGLPCATALAASLRSGLPCAALAVILRSGLPCAAALAAFLCQMLLTSDLLVFFLTGCFTAVFHMFIVAVIVTSFRIIVSVFSVVFVHNDDLLSVLLFLNSVKNFSREMCCNCVPFSI